MAAQSTPRAIPQAYVWRRIHSLLGLWLVVFLMEHLFTNSQAALFFGDDGVWFVRSVDFLRNLPYLQIIEVVLLGVPLLLHAGWGVYYMFSAKANSRPSKGASPSLKKSRNVAYSWQRITAWILLVGIILHVIQMRFLDYPYKYKSGQQTLYYATYKIDQGLYPVADRLGVSLYDKRAIKQEKENLAKLENKISLVERRLQELRQSETTREDTYSEELNQLYKSLQSYEAKREHVRGLESRPIGPHEVMASSESFGNLELLNVRETFKSVIMCLLYTAFVLAAVFHGFNGLWTFLITWGILLSFKSQNRTVHFCTGLMFLIGFLGLMSIWGTFFLNLRN